MNTTLTRRYFIAINGAVALARPALAEVATIHVVKDRNCGCCSAWIEVLEADGFAVTGEDSLGTFLMPYKADNGIPQDMISCHTGRVADYMLEGHVPPADIRRLLAERPDAIGLAVPGMPYGSPGMGPENERDAYDVFLIGRDGTTKVFTRYEAA